MKPRACRGTFPYNRHITLAMADRMTKIAEDRGCLYLLQVSKVVFGIGQREMRGFINMHDLGAAIGPEVA